MESARVLARLLAVVAIAAAGSACDSHPLPEPDGTESPTSTPSAMPPTETPVAPTPTTDPPPPVVEPPPATGFPCDVHAVLQAHCAHCHAGHLYYGPNFFTRDQLFLPAAELFAVKTHPIAPGTFGEHIATALRDDTMPPVYYGGTAPTVDERQLVIDWVAAGMPAGDCGALVSTSP